jgi:hypothetical protein
MGYGAQNAGLLCGIIIGAILGVSGHIALIIVVTILPIPLWLPAHIVMRLLPMTWERRENLYASYSFFALGLAFATFVVGFSTIIINFILYHIPGQYLNWLALPVLPIGYVAYQFKKRQQWLYGTVEILFGIATAFGSTTVNKAFQPTQGFAIISAIYIVARGTQNRVEGMEKKTHESLSTMQDF